MTVRILHGDALEQLRTLADESVHSICTDPPYELGFMGKAWDGTGIANSVELWRECLRVLKPGGHLLSFGGARTYHRMACAIEDAGFEIRDQIMWVYGSGFPKSLDVSKAIDKAAGAERGRNPDMRNGPNTNHATKGIRILDGWENGTKSEPDAGCVTDAARQWQGWGTALKPSHEPVVWATKPLGVSDWLVIVGSHIKRLEGEWQVQEAGLTIPTGVADDSLDQTATCPSESTGAMYSNTVTSWRDCWAELSQAANTFTTEMGTGLITTLRTLSSFLPSITVASTADGPSLTSGSPYLVVVADNLFAGAVLNLRAILALSANGIATKNTPPNSPDADVRPAHEPIVVARKPLIGTVAANVLAHGTGAINVDGCRVDASDQDALTASREQFATSDIHTKTNSGARFLASETIKPNMTPGRWPANLIHDGSDEVLAGFPDADGAVSNGKIKGNGYSEGYGGMQQAPSFGDSGSAARFFYTAKSSADDRNTGSHSADERNHHPTVKPTDLMQYLVRLVTPPGGTVLDPFAGSGSTGLAADREGFDAILIERDAEYVEIARRRIVGDCPLFAELAA